MGKKKQATAGLGKSIIRDRFGKTERKSADTFVSLEFLINNKT